MDRRSLLKLAGAAGAVAGTVGAVGSAKAADKVTIALIPGLTADGFYVTMHHGAEAAAKALGVDLIYQGGACLLYTSPSPRDGLLSRMPSSA